MGTIQLNKNLTKLLGISLIAFAIFLYFGNFISIAGNCWGGFGADCWSRWDSALYIDVAQNGHNLVHCPDYPTDWCGNAGWAPLYPLTIRLLHFVFPQFDWLTLGLYLSHFFVICSLLFIAFMFPNAKWYTHLFACLIYVFAPGNIYLHAIFPLSMLVFILLLCFYFLQKSQFITSGIFAFFAVLTYSIGFVLILAIGTWFIHDFFVHEKMKINWKKSCLLIFPIAGILTWFVYDYLKTGHWNALFLIQAKYGHSFNTPWKYMEVRFTDMIQNWHKRDKWIEIQNFALWIVVLYACYEYWKIRKENKNWIFFLSFTFLFLAVPYSTSPITAIYRNAVVLIPSWIILTQSINYKKTILALAAFIVFAYPLGILFIQSVLK